MRSPHKKLRTHREPAEIERLVEAYHGSGLTQVAFARRHGLAPATLSYWLGKGKASKRKRPRPTGPALVPVQVVDAPGPVAEPFEIVLANDRMVRVGPAFDAEALRRLLAVMEG